MGVICIENVKWNVIKVFVAEGVTWMVHTYCAPSKVNTVDGHEIVCGP